MKGLLALGLLAIGSTPLCLSLASASDNCCRPFRPIRNFKCLMDHIGMHNREEVQMCIHNDEKLAMAGKRVQDMVYGSLADGVYKYLKIAVRLGGKKALAWIDPNDERGAALLESMEEDDLAAWAYYLRSLEEED